MIQIETDLTKTLSLNRIDVRTSSALVSVISRGDQRVFVLGLPSEDAHGRGLRVCRSGEGRTQLRQRYEGAKWEGEALGIVFSMTCIHCSPSQTQRVRF